MSTQKNLITLCVATVFTLGLAACGGGGGGDSSPVTMMDDDTPMDESPMIAGQTVPSGTTITLPADVELQDGTLRAAMDETITVEGIGTFTCVSADGCSVDLTDGVITTDGDITVVSLDVTDATILAQLADALPPEPVELTELETAQADAAAAAADAMTAAGNAKTAADDADTARANAATLQTGETSGGLAEKAREQADAAHAAYADAKDASDAAAAAASLADAIEARIMAENARDAAQEAETMAGDYAQQSMDAAGMELMIAGTMKSVDGTTIDADAPNKTVTTITDGESTTANTGFQADLDEEATGGATGRAYAAADLTASPPTAEVTYRQTVAARDITIGKTVDSDDDTARLAIINSYAGSKTVKVFAYAESDPEVTINTAGRVSTTLGKVITALGGDNEIGGTDADADTTANLRSLGTYYLAGDDDNGLLEGDVVAADAESLAVYSYVSVADNPGTPDVDETELTYLVLDSSRSVGDTTVYVYRLVDIIVDDSRRDGPDDDTTADDGQVTANIPDATEYEHIHFGVWASLNADGTAPDGIGIGFVQNFAGAPTEVDDMPNIGTSTSDGNWVATIQAANPDGNGAVTLEDDVAAMTADFEEMTVEAELTGLATLSGDISGNTFSGTKVSDITHGSLSSDADDFTGSTSGGPSGFASPPPRPPDRRGGRRAQAGRHVLAYAQQGRGLPLGAPGTRCQQAAYDGATGKQTAAEGEPARARLRLQRQGPAGTGDADRPTGRAKLRAVRHRLAPAFTEGTGARTPQAGKARMRQPGGASSRGTALRHEVVRAPASLPRHGLNPDFIVETARAACPRPRSRTC